MIKINLFYWVLENDRDRRTERTTSLEEHEGEQRKIVPQETRRFTRKVSGVSSPNRSGVCLKTVESVDYDMLC